MLQAYFNYPNARVTIHAGANCSTIEQQHKDGKRKVRLTLDTLSVELSRFSSGQYKFASTSSLNDMWLAVDLGSPEYERATIAYIRDVLGRRYAPFARITLVEHC